MLRDVTSLTELLEKRRLVVGPRLAQAKQLLEVATDVADGLHRLCSAGLLTAWQADQLSRGQLVLTLGDGQFILLDELSGWPLGRCFLAESVAGERVFIKLLSSRLTEDRATERALLASVGKLAKLEYPSLLVFREAGRAGPRIFLVSKMAGCCHLEEALQRWGAPGNLAVLRIVEQLAGALRAMHQRGACHGLLHPGSVRLTEQGDVLLADAGLAPLVKIFLKETSKSQTLVRYWPPQSSAIDVPSMAGDWYALGKLIELLTSHSGQLESSSPSFWQAATARSEADTLLQTLMNKLASVGEDLGVSTADEIIQSCQTMMTAADAQLAMASQVVDQIGAADGRAVVHERDVATASQVGDQAGTEQTRGPTTQAGNVSAEATGSAEAPGPAPNEAEFDRTDAQPSQPHDAASPWKIQIDTKRRKSKVSASATGKVSGDGSETRPKPPIPPAQTRARGRRMLVGSVLGVLLVAVLMPTIYYLHQRRMASQTLAKNETRREAPGTAAAQSKPTAGELKSGPELESSDLPPPPPDPDTVAAKDATSDVSGPAIDMTGAAAEGRPIGEAPDSPALAAASAGADVMPVVKGGSGVPNSSNHAEGTENNTAATSSTALPAPGQPASGDPSKSGNSSEGTRAGVASGDGKPAKSRTADPASTSGSGDSSAQLLAALPKAVDLPDVAMLDEAVLAPAPADNETTVYMELIGGDRVAKGVVFRLENAQGGTAPRRWDVFVTVPSGSAQRKRVGQFALLDGRFTYRWTSEAQEQTLSGALSNCRLLVRSGTGSRSVALRKPLLVKPLKMDLDQATFSGRYEVPNPPEPSICRFEVLAIEGASKPYVLEPPGSVPLASGKQWILFGEKREDQALALHLNCSLRGALAITGTAVYQMGEEPSDEWLKGNARKTRKPNRVRLAKEYSGKLETAKRERDRLNAIDPQTIPDRNRQQELQRQQNLVKVDYAKLESEWKKVQEVDRLCSDMNGKAIHFRVVFELEGQPVELVRTEGSP